MSLFDMLRKTKKKLSERIENAFGSDSAAGPVMLRGAIRDQLLSKAVVSANEKSFPFGRVAIQLKPQTAQQYDVFKEVFIRKDALKNHLLQTLENMGIQDLNESQLCIELQEPFSQEGVSSRPLFEINFVQHNVVRLVEIPEIVMLVTRGSAEKTEYRLKKDRILVGLQAEILDREGRIIRKNDIVFLESGHESNASVSGTHARIWYDHAKRGFWIMDEDSRYGTRIMRREKVIELPVDDSEGVQLQSGDDLYFGEAIVHFEITSA